jgi:glycosyltransferase involved in cell wall biosynthesis
MKIRRLFFFSGSFPFWVGEQFVDDEMHELCTSFDEVIVICISDPSVKAKAKRDFPKIKSHYVEINLNKFEKLLSLRYLFFKDVIGEVWRLLLNKKYKNKLLISRIILLDYAKARKIYSEAKKIVNLYVSDQDDKNLFYSYWHDIRAIGMIMLKKQFSKSKFIARAHRWDIYFEENTPQYLTFKNKLFQDLNATILISEDASTYIKSKFPNNEKIITVQKLGKNNNRKPSFNKINFEEIMICSCSTLTEVKCVDKIITTLALIGNKNVKWVHFGDGPLMKTLREKATSELQNICFQFMGNRENSEILDFYNNNHIDLFINLSSSEGIPVSIMEAFSSAIPVLATNVGGVKEIINIKNGYLIDKDLECQKISSKIDEHLNLNSEKSSLMRKNAYEYWKNNFDATKNYKKFINYINTNL